MNISNAAVAGRLAALALALTAGVAAAAEAPSTVEKVEQAVVHGAQAAASGVERGVKAAASGVERGAKAATRGVKAAASGAARGARAAASGVERGAKASTSDPGVGQVLPAKRHASIAPAYAGQSRR